jgi:hypothetical protein
MEWRLRETFFLQSPSKTTFLWGNVFVITVSLLWNAEALRKRERMLLLKCISNMSCFRPNLYS